MKRVFNNLRKPVSFLLSIVICLGMMFFVPFRSTVSAVTGDMVVTYPVPSYITLSSIYQVSVNGQTVKVQKDGNRSFVQFSFCGTANVSVTVNETVSSYNLSPESYGISSTKSGKNINFTLKVPRYLILWDVNGTIAEKLFILADKLEDNAPKLTDAGVKNIMDYNVDNTGNRNTALKIQTAINDASTISGVVYFPAGVYRVDSQLVMKNNVTLYLAGGAYIRGRPNRSSGLIDFSNVSNSKIMGPGVLDANTAPTRTLTGMTMSNITLDGFIIQRQYGDFHTWLQNPTNLTMKNLKLVGDVRSSGNDGLDFDGGQNVLLYDNFVYSGDDCTSPKVYGEKDPSIQRNVDNVNTVHFVGWNDGSGAGIKTFEAYNRYVERLTYEDVDIVNSPTDYGIALYAVGGGQLDNVWLKNVRVERLQNRNGANQGCLCINGIDWNPWGPTDPAFISNIYLQNVSFKTFGTKHSSVFGRDSNHYAFNITFDHLTIENTVRTTAADAQIDIGNYTSNVTFVDNIRPIISITTPTMYASEAGTNGVFTVSRTGSTSAALTIPLIIRGTATNITDYSSIPASVTIPAGQSSTNINVATISDGITEGPESVVVELQNIECSVSYLLSTNWRGVVVIND